MIDYYYEFPEGTRLFDRTTRFAFMRGYHPEEATPTQHLCHSECYVMATRIWLENANGAVLVKIGRRDVHEPINPRELTWIKLQAREIEL